MENKTGMAEPSQVNQTINPQAHGKKSTDIEIENRIQEVFKLICKGRVRNEILRYASKWDLSDRQVDEYIYRAQERLYELNKTKRELIHAQVINGLWENIEIAKSGLASQFGLVEVGEVRQSLMAIAKLAGLDQQNISLKVESVKELDHVETEELTLMLNDDNIPE